MKSQQWIRQFHFHSYTVAFNSCTIVNIWIGLCSYCYLVMNSTSHHSVFLQLDLQWGEKSCGLALSLWTKLKNPTTFDIAFKTTKHHQRLVGAIRPPAIFAASSQFWTFIPYFFQYLTCCWKQTDHNHQYMQNPLILVLYDRWESWWTFLNLQWPKVEEAQLPCPDPCDLCSYIHLVHQIMLQNLHTLLWWNTDHPAE